MSILMSDIKHGDTPAAHLEAALAAGEYYRIELAKQRAVV